ncbi:Lpg1974 family pore-forming outer membrane protein [Bremerella sp. JC770]|uniref:Lpg1974 family pore-forming outer membrane protein n=1 Tax=Bremerella sp. JC770 TaxID=3232137 RepID=UPI003459D025
MHNRFDISSACIGSLRRVVPLLALGCVAWLASIGRAEADHGAAFMLDDSQPVYVDGEWLEVASAPATTLTPFAQLLTLKLTEGSAENWAQEITPLGSGSLAGTARLVDAPFEWNAAVRAGIERAWPEPGTSIRFYYTYFGTSATNHAAGEVYSAFLGNFFADNADGTSFGPKYRSADVEWDVQFHTIDLEFKRTFMISPALTIRPFVGVKSAIIKQDIDSRWYGPIDSTGHDYQFNSATEVLKQDFWGIGPAIGADALVPLSMTPTHSLQAYFTPSAALMYGNWNFSEVYQTDGPTSTTVPTPSNIAINSDPIHGAATMLRFALGVEWEQPGCRVSTRVRLGYEAQVWLNQMQFYSYNMGRLNNLMSLQGGVLEIGLTY